MNYTGVIIGIIVFVAIISLIVSIAVVCNDDIENNNNIANF